jgi:hypothetical protein
LGDLLTKGIVVGPAGRRRLRFPSAVAHELLDDAAEPGDMLLGDPAGLLRPTGFEPRDYPRTRSYPGAGELLAEIGTGRHRLAGARFAGWLAAAYGRDRRILGREPTSENVDALVRRALLLSVAGSTEIELALVVDQGPKAEALLRYAKELGPKITIEGWSLLAAKPIRVTLGVRASVLDAAECATARLPPELALEHTGRLLLVDIGYLRTKLALVSSVGCEHQELLDGIGVADSVRRILSDGQEQGLVEDELAVIRALERREGAIEVAGRRFDVSRALASAERSLVEEISRGVERVLVDDFVRRGEVCRAVVLLGGGAALLGQALAARLQASELHLGPCSVASDPSFMLVEGAERALRERGR